jgi:hypothetical protein
MGRIKKHYHLQDLCTRIFAKKIKELSSTTDIGKMQQRQALRLKVPN